MIPEHVPTGDNTSLSWHDRCPRLYHYTVRRGLRSKGTKSALQFGSLLHEGLEAWYRTRSLEAALQAVKDYQDFEEFPGEYRTRGRAMVTISEYIEWWGMNTSWWGEDVLFTETPFTLEGPDGFRYGGKIDLIVLYHGRPWIVDHKSTSRGGAGWWTEYKNSPQMAGYVWAGSLLHGEPIAGVIINRLLIHKNKKQPSEQFARQAFLYPPEKVEEWKASKIQQYQEIGVHIDQDYFPPRMRNCVEKYGPCQFFDVCTTAKEEDREKLLARNFVNDPWDWMEAED